MFVFVHCKDIYIFRMDKIFLKNYKEFHTKYEAI